MAVLVVEHVPGEGPYAIGPALDAAGLRTRLCRVWAGDVLPESLVGIKALVVMGGPMAGHSDDAFPTRGAELALLRAALAADVPVLGVCLGARLLAVAAGGSAVEGSGLQVGWGDVRTGPPAAGDKGTVLGVDVTPAMLTAAAREGREGDLAHLLVADCLRLPLPSGTVDGVFSAGLLDPSGRAERAARHAAP